jgi:hypothetical protein
MNAKGFSNNEAGDFMQFLQLACGGWFSDLSTHGQMLGFIRHEGGVSLVEIRNYGDPLVNPPKVNCWEKWVNKTSDWHYEVQNGCFCWVLEDEWREYFSAARKKDFSRAVLTADAAEWLCRAMSLVLGRHWFGYEYGEIKWREDWQDYSHGHEGVVEYRSRTWRKS